MYVPVCSIDAFRIFLTAHSSGTPRFLCTYFWAVHTNLLITIARIVDAALLRELSITTFVDSFAKDNTKENMDKYLGEELTLEKLTEELQDNNNIFFLAWQSNELIGFAKLRLGKIPAGLEKNSPIEIERIYVRKEYHSKKIGAQLMAHCLQHANGNGHDIIWLGVYGANHKAISFYERWGFEVFGSHNFKLGDDIQTDILMRKSL